MKFKQLGINQIARLKAARTTILNTAASISASTKDVEALAKQRASVEGAIVDGTKRGARKRLVKPSLDSAAAELIGSPEFMNLCKNLDISKERIRELVQEGLDAA